MSTECMKTYRILKILTSIWPEKPSKRVLRMPQFWGPFLLQNWSKNRKILDPLFGSVLGSSGLRFGTQNGIRKSKKTRSQNGTSFWKVWETPWNCLGSLLGRLGPLLGSLMCQNTCKKHIKTHPFEIASFRYDSSLGPLLEAVLVPFGPFWAPKWAPNSMKTEPKIWPKTDPEKVRFRNPFWPQTWAPNPPKVDPKMEPEKGAQRLRPQHGPKMGG